MSQFFAGQGHEPPDPEDNVHSEPRIELRADDHGKHVPLGGKPFTMGEHLVVVSLMPNRSDRLSSPNEETQSLISYILMS